MRNGLLAVLLSRSLVITPEQYPAEYFSGVVQSVTRATFHGPLLLMLHSVLGLLLVAF